MEAMIDTLGTLPVALTMWLMIVLAGACLVKAVRIWRKL